MRWTTSLRSMNCSSASARMRLRSSEGWKEKSKPASVLTAESLRHLQRHPHAPVLAQGEFLGEKHVDGFERRHLAAFDAAHRGVEDLEGPRHFQADEGALDAIDHGQHDPAWRLIGRLPDRPGGARRRRRSRANGGRRARRRGGRRPPGGGSAVGWRRGLTVVRIDPALACGPRAAHGSR